MSTLFVAECLVPPTNCSGFWMFSPVPNVCKGLNIVRVPPRAQQIPSSEGFFALT